MRRNAFSLPELLVAVGIGALVMTVLVSLVIWGMRTYTVQSVENLRFQLGSLVIQRLRADLRAASASGVSVLSSPDRSVIAIQRLEDLTTTGEQVWSNSLVVYVFESGRIVRGTYAPAPTRPTRLSADSLRTLAVSAPVVLMDEVSRLEVGLQGRTVQVDLFTEYRVPYRAQKGRQEFHTSLALHAE